MKNRHKYRVLCYCQENRYFADILLLNQVAFTATTTFLICHPRIIASHCWPNVGTWQQGTYNSAVLKNANSVYTLTAEHWCGGEAPNVTLIPFKWHLWSRDIILIYPLNPPFAALFAAITHTFFIICIVFCVNYVDLRSSQGNFSLWKWNEVQIIQDWTRESSSSSPAPLRCQGRNFDGSGRFRACCLLQQCTTTFY